MVRARVVLALVGVFLLAPALAAVMIGVLLLFGVDPHLVFLPGHLVKSGLEGLGIHAPNQVGVLSTVVCWWALILAVWLLLRRIITARRGTNPPETR
jgi:hypothetical protein